MKNNITEPLKKICMLCRQGKPIEYKRTVDMDVSIGEKGNGGDIAHFGVHNSCHMSFWRMALIGLTIAAGVFLVISIHAKRICGICSGGSSCSGGNDCSCSKDD